jgi:antitoxin CptB
MSALEPADAEISVRRRRLVFRAWHRGTLEMDLIMGRFADAHAATLTSTDIDLFEALMEAPDGEIFHWITGSVPTQSPYDTDLLRRIRAFHASMGPLHG